MELILLLLLPVALGGLLLDSGGDDVMRGNSSANTISGRAGDDLIFGYRGDVTPCLAAMVLICSMAGLAMMS